MGTVHAPADSARGVQMFVEVGPGKVLCGLMRQIDRGPKCANVGDEPSLHKTTEFLDRIILNVGVPGSNSASGHEF